MQLYISKPPSRNKEEGLQKAMANFTLNGKLIIMMENSTRVINWRKETLAKAATVR